VKINDVALEMSSFTVDYDEGLIVIAPQVVLAEEDVVTCCYYTPTESVWELTPKEGVLTRIRKTEVQFSEDIIINNYLIMDLVIDHPLAGADYVASSWQYRGARDYLSGSNVGYYVPSFGGTNKSGFTSGTIILPFNYEEPIELPTNMNAKLKVYSSDGKPL